MSKERQLLYIIRNLGAKDNKFNYSILGVFDDPELAAKVAQAKLDENLGVNLGLKVVHLNVGQYMGGAPTISELIEDPNGLHKRMQEWFAWGSEEERWNQYLNEHVK